MAVNISSSVFIKKKPIVCIVYFVINKHTRLYNTVIFKEYASFLLFDGRNDPRENWKEILVIFFRERSFMQIEVLVATYFTRVTKYWCYSS